MAVSLLKRRRSDGGEVPPVPPATSLAPGAPGPPKQSKPRLKKLRFLFVLLGLGILAVISMVFGMMGAGSHDVPAIYNFAQYKASKNSIVVDSSGRTIGTLSSDQNKILLSSGQISPNVKNAAVSIEDARFYEHAGVDFRGIGRALIEDVLSQSAQQGASTITEQFVKNALEAEGSRTILEKFREAALAYRLPPHSAKEKNPTASSATGPRTKSSPSTSTRSTSARAPTGSRRRPAPTSAAPTPAAARQP